MARPTVKIMLCNLEPMKETFEQLFIIAKDPDMPEHLSKRLLDIVDPLAKKLECI